MPLDVIIAASILALGIGVMYVGAKVNTENKRNKDAIHRFIPPR